VLELQYEGNNGARAGLSEHLSNKELDTDRDSKGAYLQAICKILLSIQKRVGVMQSPRYAAFDFEREKLGGGLDWSF
jgi:hypothetical protein